MTTAKTQKSWAYKLHSWDPPEILKFLENAPEPELQNDDIEMAAVCRDVDGNLDQLPCLIKISCQGLRIGDRHVPSSQIRCITTKTGALSSMKNTLLLSCRHQDDVEFYFLNQPDLATAVMILNKVRKLQSEFVPKEVQEHPVYDYFVPKVICRCNVEIINMSTDVASNKSYIVYLDEECLCLFSEEFQTRPEVRILFQKEAGDHAVEKMAVSHPDNKFNIETKNNRYSMDVSQEEVQQLVKAMKTIKPKSLDSFKDLAGTVDYLRIGTAQQSARHIDLPSDSSSRTSTFGSYTRDEHDVIIESAKLFYRGFKDDLEAAYREGESHEDWQMLWGPVDEGLRFVLDQNLISQRDARSGGLNPDDIGHFQTSLSMIDDQLFNQEYEGAVSSLRSMREVFSESSYSEVRPILSDGDYTLLKKMFYYFLKKQAS